MFFLASNQNMKYNRFITFAVSDSSFMDNSFERIDFYSELSWKYFYRFFDIHEV
jgi:hypothetical protein